MRGGRTPAFRSLKTLYRKAFYELQAENPEVSNQTPGPPISRKRFIETTAKACVAIGLTGFMEACNTGAGNGGVAIIGAGIAGLNAAYILQKQGIKATVYEASNRAGGRIYTGYNIAGKGIATELGGEFIDTNHEEMRCLIEEFNLPVYDCRKDCTDNKLVEHTFYFDGMIRSEKEIIAEFKKSVPQIEADQGKINRGSVGDSKRLDALSILDYFRSLGISGWFYDLLNAVYTSEFGSEASEASSLNFIPVISVDTSEEFKIFGDSDERLKIKGGNQLLIDKLAEKLQGQIKLGHKLTEINLENGGYVLSFDGKAPVRAKYLVLTLPFSTLRLVKISEAVKLSAETLNTIQNLNYGTNGKMFLPFSKPLWREQGSTGYIFGKTLQNGWDSSQMQNDNKGARSYTVFLGGKAGAGVQASLGAEQPFLDELNNIFAGAGKAYIKEEGPKAFNWTNHPFALGSYSCPGVNQGVTMADTSIKSAGNLFFAGEHCSKEFVGFMNGGAETGKIAAQAVIDKIKVDS